MTSKWCVGSSNEWNFSLSLSQSNAWTKNVLSTLLIRLISSNKYWRVARKLVLVLKEVIPVKFSFYEILKKVQTKKKYALRCKTGFWENFDFRGFTVTLIKTLKSKGPNILAESYKLHPPKHFTQNQFSFCF